MEVGQLVWLIQTLSECTFLVSDLCSSPLWQSQKDTERSWRGNTWMRDFLTQWPCPPAHVAQPDGFKLEPSSCILFSWAGVRTRTFKERRKGWEELLAVKGRRRWSDTFNWNYFYFFTFVWFKSLFKLGKSPFIFIFIKKKKPTGCMRVTPMSSVWGFIALLV